MTAQKASPAPNGAGQLVGLLVAVVAILIAASQTPAFSCSATKCKQDKSSSLLTQAYGQFFKKHCDNKCVVVRAVKRGKIRVPNAKCKQAIVNGSFNHTDISSAAYDKWAAAYRNSDEVLAFPSGCIESRKSKSLKGRLSNGLEVLWLWITDNTVGNLPTLRKAP